jgi:DNA-binding NarL/FixJ family response regulator
MNMTDAGGTAWEIGAGTGLDFGNSSTIAVATSYSQTNNFDAEVTVTEDSAAGFVPKQEASETLIPAVRRVLGGQTYYPATP